MYNLKIITCGDRKEIYKITNYLVSEGKKDEGHKIIEKLIEEINDTSEDKEESKQTKQDRIKTLNQARNNIIRLIKCNPDMQTFITLTFAKEQDYKKSKSSLNILFTLLRKRYKQLKYLWVLEYGDINSRLHYHLLCNISIDIKLSSSREKKSKEHKQLEQDFANKYWRYGIVDIRQLHQEDNSNIALYVATYIVKSMENLDLEGYRVYGYSKKTLSKPIEEKIYTTDSLEEVLRQYTHNYDISYSNNYSIGYKDYKGNHIGNVIYFDLNKKECIKNES